MEVNVYVVFKQSYQCVTFYIKISPCTYMFVESQQGGTECSVGPCAYHLNRTIYCKCAGASVLFHSPHDQKKSLYCKYFLGNRRHYLLVRTVV